MRTFQHSRIALIVASCLPASVCADGSLPRLRVHPALLAQAAGTPVDAAVEAPGQREADAAVPLQEGTTLLDADRVDGRAEDVVQARGRVEVLRDGTRLNADELDYTQSDDIAVARGNVRLQTEKSLTTGPYLRLRLSDNVGEFEQPVYQLQQRPRPGSGRTVGATGYGHAERLELLGEDRYRLHKATYNTCGPENPDWYLSGETFDLDNNTQVGESTNTKVVFKGVPLFYSPWLTFPLNNERKSGFLAPTIGTSTLRGLEVTVPWYWNIAPNMDATFAPRLMTRRGVQLNSEFRYLDRNTTSQARVEWLPTDLVAKTSRSGYSVMHRQILGGGFSTLLDLNGVSDDTYFSQLSSRISSTSQTNLLRQGVLAYGGNWGSVAAIVQRFQTLQDPRLPPVGIPYHRLPQILLNASRPDLNGIALGMTGEYVDFYHPTSTLGRRSTLYPSIALPLVTPAAFFTPKIGYHVTRYDLGRRDEGVPGTLSRGAPIFSVDTGLTFERDTTVGGKTYLQTLEPRLFYLRVPYREQADFPVFDTALADFNLAQIFSENLFTGGDRLADANQLTAATTSRLIDPETGAERLRGMVGQRYYFADQRVTLPGGTPRTSRTADILAALSGAVGWNTHMDVAWQFNPTQQRSERYTVAARYQPGPARVFNAAYRFNRGLDEQIDLSGQWPLWRRWHGIARYNYSFHDRKLVEGIAGLEYNGGCWVARVVVHRFATAAQTVDTGLFLQLELNDFSRIGSNPLQMLKRSIAGYGKINQPTADPVFGAE